MKLRIYSDMHLDWYFANVPVGATSVNMWMPPALPDDKDTILCLCGDLWVGSMWIEHAGMSWIGVLSKRFKQVLVVLGNHDYWPQGDLRILGAGDKCNALLQDMGYWNVKVLDCDTFEVDNTVFVGATLWTDMHKRNPFAMYQMPNFMRFDGEIVYAIVNDNGGWSRFTSDRWVETHEKHAKYIKLVAENAREKGKDVVVLTHHAPLNILTDPAFDGHFSNAYYSSDLSDIILDNENIKLWGFGHIHFQRDFMFEHCRIVNNAVGYQGQHFEQQGLVVHEVIEL